MTEAASLLAETNSKLKRCELQLKDSLQTGLDSKKQINELQKNCEELRREFDCAKSTTNFSEIHIGYFDPLQFRLKLLRVILSFPIRALKLSSIVSGLFLECAAVVHSSSHGKGCQLDLFPPRH